MDSTIKEKALNLALMGSPGSTPETVIERAKKFEEYLNPPKPDLTSQVQAKLYELLDRYSSTGSCDYETLNELNELVTNGAQG